jgi:hypothetical protein
MTLWVAAVLGATEDCGIRGIFDCITVDMVGVIFVAVVVVAADEPAGFEAIGEDRSGETLFEVGKIPRTPDADLSAVAAIT